MAPLLPDYQYRAVSFALWRPCQNPLRNYENQYWRCIFLLICDVLNIAMGQLYSRPIVNFGLLYLYLNAPKLPMKIDVDEMYD